MCTVKFILWTGIVKEQSNEITQFLDFLVDAILIVDEDSNVVFANESCAKLFGYKKEVLHTRTLTDLIKIGVVDDHGFKVRNFILDQPRARPMMSRGVIPCVKSNGEDFSARISIANLNFNGKKCGIATIQDYSTVKDLIDKLHRDSRTDAVTNLFNKRHLDNLIAQPTKLMHESGLLGVAYLDLNGFKIINDQYGHDVGDALLVEISQRLTSKVRSRDICFRIGGDEFLVLFRIEDVEHYLNEAAGCGAKLHDLITAPIEIDGVEHLISVGVSIGVGVLPHDGHDLTAVIKQADAAMYISKTRQLPFVLAGQFSEPACDATQTMTDTDNATL